MNAKRLTIKQASEMLDRPANAIRVQMQRGIIDIGYVEPSITGNGERLNYIIYEHKVLKYLNGGSDE